MFNYRKDDEFSIEELCKEKNATMVKKPNMIIINDVLVVNTLLNSVHNSKNDFFKRFRDKESLYFYCSNQLK